MTTSEPLSRDSVHSLIEAAIRAPSGDNCQPWKFELQAQNRLAIHILPKRAESFFDLGHRATFLSVGAVLENLRVESGFQGLKIQVQYAGGDTQESPAAIASFDPSIKPVETTNAATHQAMLDRTVNRRPYFRGQPKENESKALVANPVDATETRIFTSRRDISDWAKLIFLADRIRYSHPVIHQELFGKILLSREQVAQERMGLEFDRLGIGPGGTAILKLLKPWKRMQRLSKVGVDTALSSQSRMLALSSGAIILVTIPDDRPEDWMRSGEQVERLWIRAHELGLSVHPMTVALYLSQRYQTEGMENFLPRHEPWLKEISAGLQPFLQGDVGAMVFRAGKAFKMSGRSVRLPVEDFLPNTEE